MNALGVSGIRWHGPTSWVAWANKLAHATLTRVQAVLIALGDQAAGLSREIIESFPARLHILV